MTALLRFPSLAIAAVVALSIFSATASAQGLLVKLPAEDGVGVRYEGTYKQLVKRPNSVQGDSTIEWRRQLKISSVGKEEAEFQGKTQPCRWLEFKVQTGHAKEGDIDAGPGSVRIYKVLVAESVIRDTVNEPIAEGREIYTSFLPIVKGFRKFGDETAQPIDPPVLSIFPAIAQIQFYRNLAAGGEPADLQLPIGNTPANLFKGSLTTESPTRRSTNSAEIYRSENIPFGIAKWTAKTTTEEKPGTAPRSEFTVTNEIVEEMSAFELLSGAESELITP
ncbi:hypothetical protein Pan44_02740 [Caulifigura coniformis]|uniref:Uncharacterized protein n=1 Tax=Caulifigura coniformis TaxID=2527983 RepID=A0A517S809_9PLAN|nr:hypothetical protein [Caulifigura coniformis]QDT52265.1 hypothetical protein Pan44_02740 [Caulifigura coniformis]